MDAEIGRCSRLVERALSETRARASADIAADAAWVLSNRGHSGADGAYGAVSGKVFEYMDCHVSNHPMATSRTVLYDDPFYPVVDAFRTDHLGVLGEISYKKSAAGVRRVATRTPKEVTFRVPRDQAASAQGLAHDVEGSPVSTAAVNRTTERGATALSRSGASASAYARAAGRAAGCSACLAMILGGASDLHGLWRGNLDMGWIRFLAERIGDAAHGAGIGLVSWCCSHGVAWVLSFTSLAGGVIALALSTVFVLGVSVQVGSRTEPLRARLVDAVSDWLADVVEKLREVAARVASVASPTFA